MGRDNRSTRAESFKSREKSLQEACHGQGCYHRHDAPCCTIPAAPRHVLLSLSANCNSAWLQYLRRLTKPDLDESPVDQARAEMTAHVAGNWVVLDPDLSASDMEDAVALMVLESDCTSGEARHGRERCLW